MGLLDGTTQSAYYDSDDLGNYQFVSLEDIISGFMIAYVGEGKIVSKVNRTDVVFHAKRALRELSFDTFKSCKTQEIEIPPSLTMMLPQDYVNYVKLSWSDDSGIQHVVYPARKTSNPMAIKQNDDGTYDYDADGDGSTSITETSLVYQENSDTWENYKSSTPEENQVAYNNDTFWLWNSQRFGIDPQYAQVNGSFFIDCNKGLIHFSSNINGKTVTLEYISDSLGTDDEMKVHKFAEDAMYKHILCDIVSNKMGIPEYVIRRYKKDKFNSRRTAKLRLSNIKIEEITQILRGKAKHIKH